MCVLGCMLLSESALARGIDSLSKADFYKASHQWYFEIMKESHANNEVIDMVVMKSKLLDKGLYEQSGGTPYLVLLGEAVASVDSMDSYIKIVKDKATRRAIDTFGNNIIDSLMDPDKDTDEVLLQLTEGVKDVERAALSKRRKSIPYIMAEDITAKNQNFVINNFVPESAITILSAEGESGKTTLVSHWIACLSAGTGFPGRAAQDPIKCWWVSNEDNPASRIKPSLIAHGGNLANIPVTSGWFEGFTPKGIKDCDQFIGDMGIKFCYFDPLWEFVAKAVAFGGSQTDIAVRTAMNGMAQVLLKHGCSMVGAGHVAKATAQSRKAGQANAASAVPYGSVEMFNVARSALTLVPVENDANKKIVSLHHIKCNVGRQSNPVVFEIMSDEIEVDNTRISLGRLGWMDGAHRPSEWAIIKSAFMGMVSGQRLHRDNLVNLLRGAGYGNDTIKATLNRPELMREGHEFWLDPFLMDGETDF